MNTLSVRMLSVAQTTQARWRRLPCKCVLVVLGELERRAVCVNADGRFIEVPLFKHCLDSAIQRRTERPNRRFELLFLTEYHIFVSTGGRKKVDKLNLRIPTSNWWLKNGAPHRLHGGRN